MRFKLDENLAKESATLLAAAGHEALTATEQNLAGSADETLYKACMQEKRTLITLDLGFADIRLYPPQEHSGITVLHPRRQDRERILSAVKKVIQALLTEPVEGRLWIVEQARIRIRSSDLH